MAGTACTYNGISLSMVKTAGIEQRPSCDPSRVDVLWYVYTLKTESIFSILDNGGLPNHVPGETTPHAIMARLRHMLLQPRKAFNYGGGPGGGDALFDIPDGLDANNGPTPLRCDIVSITDNTFRVLWDVEVSLADCDGSRQKFASNRWEQTHDIDNKGYSTLTTTGSLVLRSDLRQNPDQMRGLTAPPLGPDFVRDANYRLSRDGLTLAYTYRDVQKYLLPPAGCTVAAGDFAIVTRDGGSFDATVNLTLEGWKGSAKRDLMATAVLMAMRKLESAKPMPQNADAKSVVITGAAWREDLFENRVSVSLTAPIRTSTKELHSSELVKTGENIWDYSPTAATARLGIGIMAILNDATKSDEEKKTAIDDLREDVKTAEDRQTQSLVQSPPWQRFNDPLLFTEQDADGIDPGLRGNAEFLSMVAAAFRDPCVSDAIGNVRANLKDVNKRQGGDGPFASGSKANTAVAGFFEEDTQADSIAAGKKAMVNANAGVNRLRTFAVNDIPSRFEKNDGRAGDDPFVGIYTTWICSVRVLYGSNGDVCQRTVEGQPGAIIRWSNQEATVTVSWTAEKVGFPPEFPVCVDSNLFSFSSEPTTENVTLAADGVTPVFRSAGINVYKALDASKVAARAAIPPWMRADIRSVPSPLPTVLDLSIDPGEGSTTSGRLTAVPGIPPVNP